MCAARELLWRDCVTDRDTFLDEVTEAVRRDRLFRLWRRFGPYVITTIFLLVVAFAAWEWWQASQERKAREYMASFIETLESEGADDAEDGDDVEGSDEDDDDGIEEDSEGEETDESAEDVEDAQDVEVSEDAEGAEDSEVAEADNIGDDTEETEVAAEVDEADEVEESGDANEVEEPGDADEVDDAEESDGVDEVDDTEESEGDALAEALEDWAADVPSGYALLARLTAAARHIEEGDSERAAELYGNIAEDESYTPLFRELAQLKQVLAESNSLSPEEFEMRLRPLTLHGRIFRDVARELLAGALLAQEDAAAAREIIEALEEEGNLTEGAESRLQALKELADILDPVEES